MTSRSRTGWPTRFALVLLAGGGVVDAPRSAGIGPDADHAEPASRLSGFITAEMEHRGIPALVLASHGYGVIVHGGYRPWRVTRMFFDATPEHQRIFVADPASGSRHNRGAAVDIGLDDRTTGEVQDFVSGYDEFSERAFPRYVGGTSEQRWLRELLRQVMEREGFDLHEHEWRHFDYGAWERYGIQNVPPHQIGEGALAP